MGVSVEGRLVVGASRRAKERARDFGLGQGAGKTRAAPRENRRTRVVRTFFTSNRFFSATSAMIACEPGSRGRGATHTVRGRGEILKLVSIRGVEFANRNVFFDVRSKSEISGGGLRVAPVCDDERRAIEDGCVFIHTSASLYPSTPARPRATRACWSPSRSRWRP